MSVDPAFVAILLVTFVFSLGALLHSMATSDRVTHVERYYRTQDRKNQAIGKVFREIIHKVWPNG